LDNAIAGNNYALPGQKMYRLGFEPRRQGEQGGAQGDMVCRFPFVVCRHCEPASMKI